MFRAIGWRSPKNRNRLAPKIVRSIWNVMKLTFKFAVKWGYLNENPMAEKRVELPRGSTKRQRQPAQLTAAEFFLLLSRFGAVREARSYLCWLEPRISEAFGLKWQDLHLEVGVVTFRQLRSGAHHTAQDRGIAYQSADTGEANMPALCGWRRWDFTSEAQIEFSKRVM